jgi:NAD(P)H dehydrogenase (quinone)
MKKILVTGATGQVGGALIPHLLAVYLDLDKFDSMMPALKGIDRIFLMTGYTVDMLRQSKDLVDAAKKAGVEQIVHLGACGDGDTHVGHYGWHQFIERYIASSGIRFYTHLRPKMFMQNLLGYGGESFVKQNVIRQYVGNARLSWVDCYDVAAAAAAALVHPAKHHAKTYRMGYEARSYSEIAETMETHLGQPFSYEARPAEEFLKKVLAAGGEPAYMKWVPLRNRRRHPGRAEVYGDVSRHSFQRSTASGRSDRFVRSLVPPISALV